MDPFSAAILLFLIFITYTQGVLFASIGLLVVYLIVFRDFWSFLITLAGIGALEFLEMEEYWFVVLAVVIAVILIREKLESRKKDYYSSDLMGMLDEY